MKNKMNLFVFAITQGVLLLTLISLTMNVIYGAEPKILNIAEFLLVLYAFAYNFVYDMKA